MKLLKVKIGDGSIGGKGLSNILSSKIKEFSPQTRKQLTILRNLLLKDENEARFYFEERMSGMARVELQHKYPFLYTLIKTL